MSDSFIQVAPDGGGKSVDMDLVATAAGATIYRQKAVLVGETGDILQALLDVQRKQLIVMRALLANIQASTPNAVTEDDFSDYQ